MKTLPFCLGFIALLLLSWSTACTRKTEEASTPAPASAVAPVTGNLQLEGKVTFKGVAPKAEKVRMSADAACAKADGGVAVIQKVKASATGELGDVFVYIKQGPSLIPAGDLPPVTVDQKNCQYQPHVIGLQVNQTLRILNSDPTLHNVNVQAKKNSPANFGMPTKGQIQEKRFTVPEVMIRTKCDVHGWMNAYIGVVEHKHFQVTGTDGKFRFEQLAPGQYVVEAWHESLGTQSKSLDLKEGVTVPVTFEFTQP